MKPMSAINIHTTFGLAVDTGVIVLFLEAHFDQKCYKALHFVSLISDELFYFFLILFYFFT